MKHSSLCVFEKKKYEQQLEVGKVRQMGRKR
jgi:hypothetical protein